MRKIVILVLGLLPMISFAQDIGGGVRLGLNINRFIGPTENSSESFDNNTGFVVGGLLNVELTELFGIRGEFLFSQKGGRALYNGQGAMVFNAGTEGQVLLLGERNEVIRVSNSYIDIPIMVYFRPIEKIKIFAGVNVGFLVASTGFGELSFNGESAIGKVPVGFTFTRDHNYLKDEGFNTAEIQMPISISADGSEIVVPTETAGAYVLNFAERGDPTFNKFDFGLIGGVAYYLNSSLFISGMVNYGLSDITNNDKDISKQDITAEGNRILRDDVDRNLSLQLSLGFEF